MISYKQTVRLADGRYSEMLQFAQDDPSALATAAAYTVMIVLTSPEAVAKLRAGRLLVVIRRDDMLDIIFSQVSHPTIDLSALPYARTHTADDSNTDE